MHGRHQPALILVKKNCGQATLEGTIIHTDGGSQYYSNVFNNSQRKLQMINSMTLKLYTKTFMQKG